MAFDVDLELGENLQRLPAANDSDRLKGEYNREREPVEILKFLLRAEDQVEGQDAA